MMLKVQQQSAVVEMEQMQRRSANKEGSVGSTRSTTTLVVGKAKGAGGKESQQTGF